MSDIAIRVEGLGKRYCIGARRGCYRTLRETLVRAARAPFRLLSRGNGHREENTIWALKHVSFQVKQGEVVGVIGRNGAGKSTLLKILSRITDPTEGCAQVRGRVRALLEVGTAFHPELTGRENTYLNGAILGMKRAEIGRKFDEIVSFAGVEEFVDTPVKHYSSGMYMRLAFSVAAHLEPEILFVDEVLAVGDAEFQQKCLGKMKSVAGAGRTILFVSHNMSAIRSLCERAILLDSGQIAQDGPAPEAIASYLDRNLTEGAVAAGDELQVKMEGVISSKAPTIRFREIALLDSTGSPRREWQSDEPIIISITYECLTSVVDLRLDVFVVDGENNPILVSQNLDHATYREYYHRDPGVYRTTCVLPANLFGENRFYLTFNLIHPKIEHLILNKLLSFDVSFRGYQTVEDGKHSRSIIRPLLEWSTRKIS